MRSSRRRRAAGRAHIVGGPDGRLQGRDDWGANTVDEAAVRHGAGVEKETKDAGEAYARFPEPAPRRYGDGWLPVELHRERPITIESQSSPLARR